MSELKPCPFCGRGELSLQEDYVWCLQCDATGPAGMDFDETSKLWNQRGGPGE